VCFGFTLFAGESARAFLNVPYCAPPLGSLRFREPQPPLPWDGTRDATAYGKEPVQGDEGRLPFQVPRGDERDAGTGLPAYMAEDSLSLNVFTPVGEPAGGSAPLPVLFYIYGGGFNNGAGSLPMYDGTRLANRQGGAVVVTINYRLGGLGFLYKPGGDIPANLGLLDMLAALRWVQKEIAAFGGDAERVTIFGESAGGMACGALLGSPLSKGLFSRAICISGSASAAQSETSAGQAAAALAVELGVPYGTCSSENTHIV
jgi:para-nitrobenzyl esterase